MIVRVPAIAGLLICLSTLAYGFNRAEIHSQEVGRNRVSERELLSVGYLQAPTLSSSSVDWVVSESVSPSRFKQRSPAAKATDSSWIVAWHDDRLGAEKIFLCEIDSSGTPLGPEIMVAGSGIGFDYIDPKLAVSDSGTVHLFFRDATNGLIYGSQLGTDLFMIDAPYLVNDTTQDAFAGLYDIAVFASGNLVVVWENSTAFSSTIEVKGLLPDGSQFFASKTVNSGGGLAGRWEPSVAIDTSQNFLVAWEDYRSGPADIYIRYFNGSGQSLGLDNNIVPAGPNAFDQFAPRVAYSRSDEFVIGWIDDRQGRQVFIQQYTNSFGLVGGNQQISDSVSTDNWDLALAVSAGEKLVAVWSSLSQLDDLVQLRFETGFVPSGPATKVNMIAAGVRRTPALAFGPDGKYAICWVEALFADGDIDFRIFDSFGQDLSAEGKLNTDEIGAPSDHPAIVQMLSGNSIILFVDQRNDAGDIFLQTFDNSGNKLSSNIKLNQDASGNLQAEPSLARSDTRALAVWFDSRQSNGYSGKSVFGRFLTSGGQPDGAEFIISDSTMSSVAGNPKVVMNSEGRALVAWLDNRISSDSLAVYGQWLTSSGSLDGPEFPISTANVQISGVDLHLGLDSLDRFYAIWHDVGRDSSSVEIVSYEMDGTEYGRISWTPGLDSVRIDEIAAAVNDRGDIHLAWTGVKQSRKLYLTILGADSSIINSSFEISESPLSMPTDPTISIDNAGFISLAWIDRRSGRRALFSQILRNDLTPFDANYQVSPETPEFMKSPATSAFRGIAWYCWSDPRTNGLNIYASNLVYLPTAVDDEQVRLVPRVFSLRQNYPNPFNPETIISFSMKSSAEVELSVINVLGRQVRVLADGLYHAGEHSVLWDGRDDNGRQVSSGVYFYRLKSDELIESRKMMLLK